MTDWIIEQIGRALNGMFWVITMLANLIALAFLAACIYALVW